MKEKILNQEELKSIFEYDANTGKFYRIVNSRRRPNSKVNAGCISRSGYVAIFVKKHSYYAHRLAWLYIYGEWPEDKIDHINGIRSDNRIANLRKSDARENCENRRTKNKTKASGLMIGVSKKKGNLKRPYSANIQIKGKLIHLGYFETEIIAHNAYLAAKRLLHSFCTI